MKRVIWGLVIALVILVVGVFLWVYRGPVSRVQKQAAKQAVRVKPVEKAGKPVVHAGAGKARPGAPGARVPAVKGPGRVIGKKGIRIGKYKVTLLEGKDGWKKVDDYQMGPKTRSTGLWAKVESNDGGYCTSARGRVTDENGKGIVGMKVTFYMESGEHLVKLPRPTGRVKDFTPYKSTAITGPDGRYYLKCVPSARAYSVGLYCSLEQRKKYWECMSNIGPEVWAGNVKGAVLEVQDIVLHNAYKGVLEGHILSRTTGKTYTGKLQSICVEAVYQGVATERCWGRLMGLHLKEGGKYRIEGLPPGVGTITGIIYGAPDFRIPDIKIKPKGVTEYDIVIDDRPQGFYGYVRDKKTGKPVVHAPVTIAAKDNFWMAIYATAETDEQGFYKIQGIPVDKWDIAALPPAGLEYHILSKKGKQIKSEGMTRLDFHVIQKTKDDHIPYEITEDPTPAIDKSCKKLSNKIQTAFNAAVGRFSTCIPNSSVGQKVIADTNGKPDQDTIAETCNNKKDCGNDYGITWNTNQGSITAADRESSLFHELTHWYGYDEPDAYARYAGFVFDAAYCKITKEYVQEAGQ